MRTIRQSYFRIKRRTAFASPPRHVSRMKLGVEMLKPFALSLGLILAVSTGFAGESAGPAALLRRTGWVRFEIAGGRVAVPDLAHAPNRSVNLESAEGRETVLLNTTSSESSFSYSFESKERHLQVEYKAGGRFYLSDTQGQTRFTIDQPTEGPITLKLTTSGEKPVELSQRSVWHLLILHRDFCQQQLLPRLELLHPAWRLAEQADEVQEQIWTAMDSNWERDRDRWRKMVANLSSNDFGARRDADRQLKSECVAASGYLQSLDLGAFNPEQRRRIEQLVLMAQTRRDEPTQVAGFLIYDAPLCVEMLASSESLQRQKAASHLGKLFGRPIHFEASAPASVRDSQIRSIKETLLSKAK